MTTAPLTNDPAATTVGRPHRRRTAARTGVVLALPLVIYLAVRPALHSDAAALAIAGAAPLLYSVTLILLRRGIDLVGVIAAIGYGLGCVVSALTGETSLPLKLHEAAVTFVAGFALLTAAALRRPIPVGRLLRISHVTKQLDTTLGVLVGAFLLLHALLHVVLAVTLTTTDYLLVGRIVNWASLGVGAVTLWAYVRHARDSQGSPPARQTTDPHNHGEPAAG